MGNRFVSNIKTRVNYWHKMLILILGNILSCSMLIGFCGRYLGVEGVKYLSLISMLTTVSSALIIYCEGTFKKVSLGSWFLSCNLELEYNIFSIFMVLLISIITTIVIWYSSWYMENEAHRNKFILLLLLFGINMMVLTSSSNYLTLLLGWEGVGIISYFLINYYFTSLDSNKSAIQAVLYNKVGDIFLMTGIFLLLNESSFIKIPVYSLDLTNDSLAFGCILIGCMVKSAQLFFHAWLGNAMAGPTPVSSLLHSATMVTAGVYLLIRSLPTFFTKGFVSRKWRLMISFCSRFIYNSIRRISSCYSKRS